MTTANQGDLMFQGPRVRMGVHWAKRGMVVHRLHHITRHRIFAGPGMQVCSLRLNCAKQAVLVFRLAYWPTTHAGRRA